MKPLSMLLCLVAMILPLSADAKGKREGAHIKFEQTEYNFGEVSRNGANLNYTFRFVNDGTEPLVLLSVMTSCSCVKPQFSRKPIAAGESGEIKILIDVKKMDKGVFHRVVQIRSNSIGGAAFLTIQGAAKD